MLLAPPVHEWLLAAQQSVALVLSLSSWPIQEPGLLLPTGHELLNSDEILPTSPEVRGGDGVVGSCRAGELSRNSPSESASMSLISPRLFLRTMATTLGSSRSICSLPSIHCLSWSAVPAFGSPSASAIIHKWVTVNLLEFSG